MNTGFNDIAELDAMLNELNELMFKYLGKDTEVTLKIDTPTENRSKRLTIHVNEIMDIEVQFKMQQETTI